MTYKIGLLSDIHASFAPLNEAIHKFKEEGVDLILCAGDIAGYGDDLSAVIDLILKAGCKAILGNHDLWHLACEEENNSYSGPTEAYLRSLNWNMDVTIEEQSLFMVHASPPDSTLNGIKILDNNGQLSHTMADLWQEELSNLTYDILVVGHTHQVFAYQFGKTLVINPGSTLFNHTCAILYLPTMNIKLLSLSGRRPVLSWNWGQFEGDGSPVHPKALK